MTSKDYHSSNLGIDEELLPERGVKAEAARLCNTDLERAMAPVHVMRLVRRCSSTRVRVLYAHEWGGGGKRARLPH